MAPKPASTGNIKATPTPPRYKEGEAPPLPKWPINWSCIGICIETLLTIDAERLVEAINGMRPTYSMAIVDANIMASEEMALNPPTNLGIKLKDALASGDPNWLNPELLSEVFEARSILDKDDEHRREAERRLNAADLCKKDIEEAITKELEVKKQFEEALLKQKEFEDKMREAEEEAKKTQSIETTASAVVPTKEKPLPLGKGAPPSISIGDLNVERKVLEEKTAELRALLQCFETKVKIAQYWDVKRDSEKDDPMTTTRIYWCVGFGNTPQILSYQVTVKSIFQAIFNIAKKPPSLSLLEIEGAIDKTTNPNSILIESIPIPPFVQELYELAKISKQDHPSKKLPVMNVLYEDPPLEEENPLDLAAQALVKGPRLAIPKRSIQVSGGLPYEQIAKALTEATISFKQQAKAFALLEASVTENCTIPLAIPTKDINMTYYKDLLDGAPLDFISIPIIVHCIVEQVSIYECLPEDIEALEIAKENQHVAKRLDYSFKKLGHGLSCMRKPSDILIDLMERIEAQVKKELKDTKETSQKALEVEKIVAQEAQEALKMVHNHANLTLEVANQENLLITKETERNKSLMSNVASIVIEQPLSKIGGSILQDRRITNLTEIEDDLSQISELSEGSSTKTQDGERGLLIVHEFDRVGRLEGMVNKQVLEFWDSIDIIKVEKHMSSLLVYPGIRRAHMPITPVLSVEKRHACFEALKMFASGGLQVEGKETYPLYKELDDIYGPPVILEILEDPKGPSFSMTPVNIATVKRYQKLKMFLEMLLKEQRKVFQIPDTPVEETPSMSNCNDEVEDTLELDNGLTDEEKKELEKEKYLIDCGCPEVKIYRFPTPPPEPSPSILSSLSSKLVDRFFIFQKILDRKMIESFPNDFFGEIYGRARARFPFRIRRYDKDEDCILEALYADERNHEWKGTVASQMGFGEFIANINTPSPSMLIHSKHATYDIEQQDSTVIEHFRCHLTEDQGLVWTGLPTKSVIQWEPQTTVIKDGNMIFLRGYGPNDDSESPTFKGVYAILRDGLIVCFSINVDGLISMQITSSTNKTIEISSSGVILMFSSQLHAKSELEENKTEEETPMEAIGKDTLVEEESKSKNKTELTTSNIQTIRNVLLQEKGDIEAWRCVLPSGTVVRYKSNGDAQIMCRQGNVSDWRSDFEGGPCWITTNNEGFLVVQEGPPIEDMPPQPIEKTTTNIELKKETKPILTKLPNLKVAHFYDPDTKDEIITREDLVVIVTCEEQHSSLVQHADGTYIYSEVKEFFPPDPIEVVVPLKHIFGEWPSSCKDSEFVVVDDETYERQFSSVANNEHRTSFAHGKSSYTNVVPSLSKDTMETKHTNIKKDSIIKKVVDEEDCKKKQPLRGLLGDLSTKLGVKLSDFVNAQKTHSQTWAPEGYGEAPREIPDWVWPPQPLGQKRQRHDTCPLENNLQLPLEPLIKEPKYSIVWHVRKDGLAKVHGKVGAGTCVEFETEDGHYTATWSQKSSLLSLSMPGGATLSANGNIVTYSPSISFKSKNDISKIKSINCDIDTCDSSKDFNKDNGERQTKDFEEEKNENVLLNTHGCYIFDVVEGSLVFSNKKGDGFKIFGRGTEFESIIDSKLTSQLAKTANELQMKRETLDLARAKAKKLFKEMLELAIINAKDCKFIPKLESIKEIKNMASKGCNSEISLKVENLNFIKKKDEGKRLKLMTKEGQFKKKIDPFDGFDLEPPGTWKPTPPSMPSHVPSEPLEPEILGPFPRLFVLYQKGYGYEILADEMYQLYEIAKFYNKNCTKSKEKHTISNEECILHTFVTIEHKNNMSKNDFLKNEEKTQTSFPITPWLLTRRVSQFARKFESKQRNNKVQNQTDCDWLQLQFMLPNLARIINPVVPKLVEEMDNSTFVYRQILENPSISKEISKSIEKILEAYAQWQLENIDTLGCKTTLETRSNHDIEIEKSIALTKANKLAEHEVQKAQNKYSIQIQDARRVVRQKLRESTQKSVEAFQQQSLLQADIDQDWRLFLESKGGPFVCMHKPTNLVQNEPPSHPLSNSRFLYFHAEEGLRYLFICQQKMNEAKWWSIETMPPSPKSSINSNEYFQNLTEVEEKELTNIFSGMIGKVEKLSIEVIKAKGEEKKQKEEETFCRQVFSEVLVPKDPFHDFNVDQVNSQEEESCIFDFPPKLETKPKPRPPHIYEFSPTLPHLQSSSIPCVPQLLPPPPMSQISPKPISPSLPPTLQPKLQQISKKEKIKLARDALRTQRMAEKELRLKTLGPNWMIPQEFDYDYEIFMRARAFKKAFQVPKWKSNEFYITRELPNERPMQMEFNERMKLAHSALNALEWVNCQFRIFPSLIDFNIVQLGTMRMKIVIIQNYHGPRSGRIFIHKEDKLSVKFHYFHGSIAPGMYVVLRVYFRASKLGIHFSQAEIRTDNDVYSLTIKAFVISGVAPPDPNDQIEVIMRNPCDEPIDPWGTFILCRKCLTHHLHWWSKNWGLYECTKCWHFHITQEWLDAIAEKARQKRLAEEANKANRG